MFCHFIISKLNSYFSILPPIEDVSQPLLFQLVIGYEGIA